MRNSPSLWITTLLAAVGCNSGVAQTAPPALPVSTWCADLNQTALSLVKNGQFAKAESAILTPAGASGRDAQVCAGIVLNNISAQLAARGLAALSERFAMRAIAILEKLFPPNDPVLFPPLHTLAGMQFELGKTARSKESFQRLKSIHTENPEQIASVHWIAGPLLEAEGRFSEAETEYLKALAVLEKAGRGDSAEVGELLVDLGTVYIRQQRFRDAERALERGSSNFTRDPAALPLSRVHIFQLRGVLHARKGEWLKAEQDFAMALSIADRELPTDTIALRGLLTSYAEVLRKNHRRREARPIDARLAALEKDRTRDSIIDVTELLVLPKPNRKQGRGR